ncbi:hypothetical protein HBN50_14915 [Halobacteriovorax sp. GB3]|uniref:hypothetical protein n=1 Tax=Halobacteriovorax sp. GB3 TaxID=2719615 RepID=UPI002362A7BC|nr:hypothetical protein [Halobacteriovorax sp. GB3]MDD0854401.1 hypothetical protein [Halobacteriovorax sp. GB3]
MSKFERASFQDFLATVVKYMRLRGVATQKQLAELTDTGVSTMSRFMSMKVGDLDEHLIAKIVAKLQIPTMEIVDFVEEDYTDQFLRLVRLYRDEPLSPAEEAQSAQRSEPQSLGTERTFDEAVSETLSVGGGKRNANANVKIGGKSGTIPFRADEGGRSSGDTIQRKLQELTPRQKAYMTDFLHLDMEGRDLIVDLGNELFRYFRQKGLIA